MDWIITGKVFPNEIFLGLNEFLIETSDTDIEMCLVLLKLDISSKIQTLGIIPSSEQIGWLFWDNDTENWSKIEVRWADILRNTQKNIRHILGEREKLLVKASTEITPHDEAQFESLWHELEHEINIAISMLEWDIQRIICALLWSSSE